MGGVIRYLSHLRRSSQSLLNSDTPSQERAIAPLSKELLTG